MEVLKEKVKFQKYPAYKDSGVEWLGEIPEHWSLKRLGSILNPISEKNSPELPLLSITREKGVIERNIEDEDENHNYIPDDLSGYKVLKRGQFGMNKMKAWQGSYGISKYTGIVSPAYYVFDFFYEIDPDFFNIAIRSKKYISFFGSASDGVRIGQWDLSKSRMKSIPFLLPPIEEQTAIASLLDEKCGKIVTAIVQKQRLIELLKERKQIIIQEVVTGKKVWNEEKNAWTEPVEVKDSGVEWIGEIPEHWDLLPIRRIIDVRDGTHDTPLYIDQDENSHFLITSKDFEEDEINFSNAKSIGRKDFLEISKRSGVSEGDVIMSMIGGNIGKSIMANSFTDYAIKNVALFKTEGNFEMAKYIRYYLQSGLLHHQIKIQSRGGAQGFLSLGDLRNLIFFKMNSEEVASIVLYLDDECTKIQKAIALQLLQIEKLKEYKSSLIDAAVTGKIKVS